jgi:hypothetical protein
MQQNHLTGGDVVKRLSDLGLTLPAPPAPGGSYDPVVIRGTIAYMAIQFPITDKAFLYRGVLGKELTTDDGKKAAAICALNVLSQLQRHVGFDRLEGFNHIELLYRGAETWDDAPIVADGASSLLRAVLGDAGRHTRSLAGVQHLPRDFSVGLVASVTLNDKM